MTDFRLANLSPERRAMVQVLADFVDIDLRNRINDSIYRDFRRASVQALLPTLLGLTMEAAVQQATGTPEEILPFLQGLADMAQSFVEYYEVLYVTPHRDHI